MRRFALLVAAPLALFVAGIGPARADFHPVCTGVLSAYAGVGLRAETTYDYYYGEQTTLEYSGVVNCPNATIAITSLTFGPPAPPPSTDPDPLAPPVASCAPSPSPCTASRAVGVTPPPGEYQVTMLFNASRPGCGFATCSSTNVPRYGRWRWLGEGQPVPVCVPVGFLPDSLGTCS